AIYVPVIFTLAYSFGDEIEAALTALQRLGHMAWGLFFLTVSLWLVTRLLVSRPASTKRRRTES
ncbi:MAG TPA: hypothetical protein VGX03_14005, partial [Candidatus Binatia bacterium]|nr:hypothetical protein [Candidatus Binatia bacterium]